MGTCCRRNGAQQQYTYEPTSVLDFEAAQIDGRCYPVLLLPRLSLVSRLRFFWRSCQQNRVMRMLPDHSLGNTGLEQVRCATMVLVTEHEEVHVELLRAL